MALAFQPIDTYENMLDQKSEVGAKVEVKGCRVVFDASRYWELL